VAKHSQSAGASLITAPGFQSARAQFPAPSTGWATLIFAKVDWQAVKARVIAEANKTPTAKRSPGASKSVTTPPTPSWMLDMNPEVFARHLHVASSASWKDAQGLHFDESGLNKNAGMTSFRRKFLGVVSIFIFQVCYIRSSLSRRPAPIASPSAEVQQSEPIRVRVDRVNGGVLVTDPSGKIRRRFFNDGISISR